MRGMGAYSIAHVSQQHGGSAFMMLRFPGSDLESSALWNRFVNEERQHLRTRKATYGTMQSKVMCVLDSYILSQIHSDRMSVVHMKDIARNQMRQKF